MTSLQYVSAPQGSPGQVIRAMRQRLGLTLAEVAGATGLAVSSLSKLERGHVELSYDKMVSISRAFSMDVARFMALLGHNGRPTHRGGGRRVIQRSGSGAIVETRGCQKRILAADLLNKRLRPVVIELGVNRQGVGAADRAERVRRAGEEFALVIEGEAELLTELYASLHLRAGDSIYFDSEMGHAYRNASDAPCRIVAVFSPRDHA